MRLLLAFLLVLPLPALADITATRDSTAFTSTLDQIEGDVDPVSLATFNAAPTYGAPATTVNVDGTLTVVTPGATSGNGRFAAWQMDPTGDYLDRATGFTWETRFRIDSANDANRGVWEIYMRAQDGSAISTTRIHFLATGIDRDSAGFGVNAEYAVDLTDGFHVVRGAVEGGTNLTTVWVDGVKALDALVSHTYVGSDTGVIGRWGGNARGGTTTVDYLRFDTTGAYAPIPEPSAAALVLLASALGFRRRR